MLDKHNAKDFIPTDGSPCMYDFCHEKVLEVLIKVGPYKINEIDNGQTQYKNIESRTIFSDLKGNLYQGEVKIGTDLKQGRGIMIFSDGSIYEGFFLNDKRHGKGR